MKAEIIGLDNVLRSFDLKKQSVVNRVGDELREAAKQIERLAKRDAPKNDGRLAASISTREKSVTDYEVVASAQTAPMMEFGTGSKAKVDSEFATYAMQFRGATVDNPGTLEENILDWVRTKGIGQARKGPALPRKKSAKQKDAEFRTVAFLIARSIRRYGVEAHPFLLRNFQTVRTELIKKLQKLF